MTISEKIKHNNLNEVNLYLEGVFWIAYEQSAYYFWKLKGYKPTKKFVKVVGQEVVSVGFPNAALKDMVTTSLQTTPNAENHIVFEIEEAIDEENFLSWKAGIVIVRRNDEANQICILEQIKNFDMSNKTPIECMLFLSELKKLIINN